MGQELENTQDTEFEPEDQALTTPEPEEESPELVIDDDEPAVVAEESDEVTLDLRDDEQDRPSKVEVPRHTLSHLRRTRREARHEAEQKDRELQEVRQELSELRRAVIPKPRYADFDSDDAFEQELIRYHQLVAQDHQAHAQQGRQPQGQQHQQQQPPAQMPDLSEHYNAHLERVEKLGIPAAQYEGAERAVRAGLSDAVTDALIASVGEGSEKAVMVLGTKPDQLAKIQQLLREDPTGLRAVSYTARLSERASFRNKKTVSGAPKPTRSPTGGSRPPANEAEFNKRMAKLEKAGDAQGMADLLKQRRKAREAAAS